MAGYNYQYGSDGPSMGRPSSINDDMARRRQFEDLQYAAALQRNAEVRAQMNKDADLDREVQKNRLGLNGLQGMLTDRYSDAYETVDRDGDAMNPGVDVSVGSVDGGPAAPLPQVRISPLGLGRTLKPEYQEAFDSMRPEDSISSNRLTTEEFTERERIKAEYARQLTLLKAENQRLLAAQNNTSDAARTAATIQAQDMGADKNKIGADVMTTATMVNSGKPFTELDPITPPAFSDDMATATARKPSATEANGELNVSVAPAAGSKYGKEHQKTSTGTYYKAPDGTITFVHKDGRVKVMQ